MDFFEEIKTSNFFHEIQKEVLQNRFSNCTMFEFKDDVVLKDFLTLLCELLLCSGTQNETIRAGNHPDVLVYPNDGKLKVEDSENIVEESFKKPISAEKNRVFLIGLDGATTEAQNKLLKTLEDGFGQNYYVLCVKNVSLVLQTIKSRAQKFCLPRFEKSINFLGKESLAYDISGGNFYLMQKYLQYEDFEGMIDTSVSVFCDMKSTKQILFFCNKILSFKQKIDVYFDFFGKILENLLLAKVNKSCYLKKYEQKILNSSFEYSFVAIEKISQKISKAFEKLAYNANENLILEDFLLGMLEIKYLWK